MRPSRDEVLMEHAKLVAQRGTCERLQVGAVVAREGRILVSGYNGAPAGVPHCIHDCNCSPTAEMVKQFEHFKSCRKVNGCWESVHAEANAVAFAARYGMSLDGASLYCTDTPCVPCAQLIVNAGIIEVHYIREYRDERGLELLRTARLTIHQHES